MSIYLQRLCLFKEDPLSVLRLIQKQALNFFFILLQRCERVSGVVFSSSEWFVWSKDARKPWETERKGHSETPNSGLSVLSLWQLCVKVFICQPNVLHFVLPRRGEGGVLLENVVGRKLQPADSFHWQERGSAFSLWNSVAGVSGIWLFLESTLPIKIGREDYWVKNPEWSISITDCPPSYYFIYDKLSLQALMTSLMDIYTILLVSLHVWTCTPTLHGIICIPL